MDYFFFLSCYYYRDADAQKEKEKLGENPCFPGSALVDVLKKDGKECRVSMKDLGIGDLVKTIDVSTKEVKFTPVMIFAHHNVESFSTFFKLKLEDGKKIVLSGNHLIFVGPNGKTKMARYVCINDLLNLASGGMSKVVNIEEIKEKGFICPITQEGTVVVNEVLASCYASCTNFCGIDAHKIAHAGLFPLRRFKKKIKINTSSPIPNQHPYIKMLTQINLPWMAK